MSKNTAAPQSAQSVRNKLLIIRFSSVGDVIQTLGVIGPFKEKYPNTEIHWVIREDLQHLVKHHPQIQKVWPLSRKTGLRGLLQLAKALRKEAYFYVYDAHNNLRSHFVCGFLNPKKFIRRSKNRMKRILLFQFGHNLFPKKFIQEESFVTPLKPWDITYTTPTTSQLFIPADVLQKVSSSLPFQKFIALAPSSAWELKRWPIEYFQKLIELLAPLNIVILGGPEDHFCKDLIPPEQQSRVINLSGKLSLLESCAVVQLAQVTIGNDTGLSHAADQLGKPLLQMIGPVLFGYPAKKTSEVLEVPLPCRPCTKDGRGVCKIAETKKCLYDIKPEFVAQKVRGLLL